jgi:dihydrodipicolinate synthase/N-acetylneuraminate lyase
MIPAGVCPVVAVPFHKDGSVDHAGFDVVVDHLVGTGVDMLSLFGLASEFHKLTDREREQLAAQLLARTRAAGVGAMISVTDHATELAVERARAYTQAGADALTVLPPHFLQPSVGAVIAHVEAVLDVVDLPVVVQYAPDATGGRIEPFVWAELHRRHPHFRVVKVESRPAGRYVTALKEASDGALGALVGYAGLHLPDGLHRGAVGFQPGCSFVEVYVEMWRRWVAGDMASFEDLHTQLLPYISDWMQGVERIVQVEKTILRRRGILASDRCRRPGHDLDRYDQARIDSFLTEFEPLLDQGATDV